MGLRAVEFEVDAVNNVIEIPAEFSEFHSKHLKVIVLSEEPQSDSLPQADKTDFSDLLGKLQWKGDAVEMQRKLRDAEEVKR